MSLGRRALKAGYWLAPSLLCLLIYWHGFLSWFRADDFAWLGLAPRIHSFGDLLGALFLPAAQGTLRPWSERAFFILGFSLFGMDVTPFRVLIFATQFANLALVTAIGARLTGRREAGFLAAILWVVNGALIEPLGWACVYNQVMCAFFLLLAFYFLLRTVEAKPAPVTDSPLQSRDREGEVSAQSATARRFEILHWIVFLLGFGAQELNLVYPALAAAYTVWASPRQFRRTLPMFAVSLVYVLGHNRVAPAPHTGDYAVHFDSSIVSSLVKYWTWSVGPLFLVTPLAVPSWVVPAGVAVVSLALLVFLAGKLRARTWLAGFFLAWFLITIAPVLPFSDHLTEYYVYIPLIGLCWLGGWALAEAWHSSGIVRVSASAIALLYVFLVLPRGLSAEEWNYRLTLRVRDLVEGVTRVHELHPGKTILLDGVDTAQFWNGVVDHPYAALGIQNVYLTPGSEARIEAHPDWGDVGEFVLPAEVAAVGIQKGETVVYDVTGSQLRNITATYSARPQAKKAPQRLDVASPLTSYLVGPEWYSIDGNHRWMPGRATLRIGGPSTAAQQLYLHGNCADQQFVSGPLEVKVTVDGEALPAVRIPPGNTSFDLAVPLPASMIGKAEMAVGVEVNRTFRPAGDNRELGLAFGVFEIR